MWSAGEQGKISGNVSVVVRNVHVGLELDEQLHDRVSSSRIGPIHSMTDQIMMRDGQSSMRNSRRKHTHHQVWRSEEGSIPLHSEHSHRPLVPAGVPSFEAILPKLTSGVPYFSLDLYPNH